LCGFLSGAARCPGDPRIALAVVVAAVVLLCLVRRRPPTVRPLSAPLGSAEADAQTLRALRDAGADLTKETEINFYLYFPTQEAAAGAADSAHRVSGS
jgi:Regulator of ribonuclease activity B